MKIVIDSKTKMVSSLILVLIEIVVGILFLVLPAEGIINFFLRAAGVLLIIGNLSPCIYYYKMTSIDKKFQIDLISALISVVLGVLLIILPGVILSIILACWFVIMPIIRIILHKDHLAQFKRETPFLIVGLILAVFSFSFISNVAIKILGGLIILGGVLSIIYSFSMYQNNKGNVEDTIQDENVIDADYKDL